MASGLKREGEGERVQGREEGREKGKEGWREGKRGEIEIERVREGERER